VVGFTTGSRGEVPGKKENLWQEMMMIIIIIIVIGHNNYNKNNNNNNNINRFKWSSLQRPTHNDKCIKLSYYSTAISFRTCVDTKISLRESTLVVTTVMINCFALQCNSRNHKATEFRDLTRTHCFCINVRLYHCLPTESPPLTWSWTDETCELCMMDGTASVSVK
jgi:hypothetical protein